MSFAGGAFIDGRDALFFLIVRPASAGTTGSKVVLEHGGSGLTMAQAAHILRQVADRLDAQAAAEVLGAHDALCGFTNGITNRCTCTAPH
ncbi:hypothetical protein AB0O91_21185 [Kitasatospora sp. NPDC089797]|uniref:hypothetical protein n=1 Tax=Kitasatospora sp. NPDC089797 TaxID=3155298 RepID=UPI00341D5931